MIYKMYSMVKNLRGVIDPLLWIVITAIILGLFAVLFFGVLPWITNLNIQPFD